MKPRDDEQAAPSREEAERRTQSANQEYGDTSGQSPAGGYGDSSSASAETARQEEDTDESGL